MHVKRICALVAVLALTASSAALAQQAADAPAVLPQTHGIDRISSFVGDKTAGVAHIDLSMLNLQATHDWLQKVTKATFTDQQQQQQALQNLQMSHQMTQEWVDKMQKAGVTDLYMVMHAQEQGMPQTALIVPLDATDDAQQIQQLLTPKEAQQANLPEQHQMKVEKLHNAIVAAPKGAIDTFRDAKPGDVKTLGTALSAVEKSAIQFAILANENLANQIKQYMKDDQQALQNLQELQKSVKWVALGLNTPPKGALDLHLQAADEQSAQKLAQQFQTFLQDVAKNPDVARVAPNFKEDIALLKPEVQNDRVVLHLTGEELDRLVMRDIVPTVRTLMIPGQDQPQQDQPEPKIEDRGQDRIEVQPQPQPQPLPQ